MSGRKQHYIPQCLLKGFAIPSRRKTKKVWVFKKGQSAYVSSIKDVAARRHFYSELSEDGSLTLDDQITNYENELEKELTQLRECLVDDAVEATVAAKVIVHLTIRAAHLRDAFGFAAKELITGAGRIFANEDQTRAFLGIDTNVPNQQFQEQIDKMLSEQTGLFAQTGLPEPLLRQIFFTLAKENFDQFYANQSPELMRVLSNLAHNASTIARDGHVKALTRSLEPEPRVQILSQFRWTVHRIHEGCLILPDCVAVALQNNNKRPQPLVMAGTEINTVLFPVCSDRLMIGHKRDAVLPEVKGFNEAAAVCSHTFFVTCTNTPELEKLSERIGEQSEATIQDAVASAVSEFRPKSAIDKDLSIAEISATKNSAPLETIGRAQHPEKEEVNNITKVTPASTVPYRVTFIGCADEDTAQSIASAVDTIISEIDPSIPLERLDCITFAGDYAGALRNLERGFPASKPLASTEEDWGIGVAMASLVMRDGVPKVSIVARGWLGQALIAEDQGSRRTAIHILAGQLAHVACVDFICQSLPDMLLSHIEDHWESWLYFHMYAAWTAYFASRTSARFDPEAGSRDREIVLAVLEKAGETIPRERLAYRRHGNLDQFLEIAVPSIGTMIIHIATLLGHSDGLDQPAHDDGCMAEVLETLGLRLWVDTFQSDLARLFERRGQWVSVQEFLALNRHMERVLWQFGVFPWRDEEGMVRVEIPLGSDIAQLLEDEKGKLGSDEID